MSDERIIPEQRSLSTSTEHRGDYYSDGLPIPERHCPCELCRDYARHVAIEDARSSPLARAHRAAMRAKETVFQAQDACSQGWERATKLQQKEIAKMQKRLARVRAELEALDRAVTSAKIRGVT